MDLTGICDMPWHGPTPGGGGGGGSISVTDGVTSVNPTSVLDFTSGASVSNAGGGQANVANSAVGSIIAVTRGTNIQLVAGDRAKFVSCNAAFNQTLQDASILGSGWYCWIKNDTTDGATVLTVTPSLSQLIDGLSSITMYSGETRLIISTGAGFVSKMEKGGFALFTATGNWIVPSGLSRVDYDLFAPGGAGAVGTSGGLATARPGGTGGGGGARCQGSIPGNLFTPGATEPVSLSASTTTFKNCQVYKGGAGSAGLAGSDQAGGSGGGAGEFGITGGTTPPPAGGDHNSPGAINYPNAQVGQGLAGADGIMPSAKGTGLGAEWGGGSGGPARGDGTQPGGPPKGGCSVRGGGGGGAGGGVDASNNNSAGGDGGNSGFYTDAGGNGGGTGGVVAGAAGGAGANGTDGNSGKGGGGGASNSGGTGGAGGNGGIPSGGGGSGGGGATGGAAGTGGRGEARIYYA